MTNLRLDRRNLIRMGARGAAGATGVAALAVPLSLANDNRPAPGSTTHDHHIQTDTDSETEHAGHNKSLTVGEIDIAQLGWDPADLLTDFDYGTVTETPRWTVRWCAGRSRGSRMMANRLGVLVELRSRLTWKGHRRWPRRANHAPPA